MKKNVTRRDFVMGMAALAGGSILSGCQKDGQVSASASSVYRPIAASEVSQKVPYYPPAWLGLRGDHEQAQTAAHSVALQGKHFTFAQTPAEQFDLIVVGAGISGLTAAYQFQKQHAQAKILILDNHDDFGGHAKRNEFTVNGKLLITYGGSESLDSPKSTYSDNAHQLIRELGIDYEQLGSYFHQHLYTQDWQMGQGVFFNRSVFEHDVIIGEMPKVGDSKAAAIIQQFPLPDADKTALIDIFTAPKDYLKHQTKTEKERYVQQTSYYDFLKNDVKLPEKALAYLTNLSMEYWGHPINGISIRDALDSTFGVSPQDKYPAVQQLGLNSEPEEKEPYIYHFPDGNASVARLLVRRLIPAVASGSTMQDIVSAQFDYSQLDMAEHLVRIRLNSTVLRIENSNHTVSVGYLKTGEDQLQLAQAKKVIYAGHAALSPHIMPEMPSTQQTAMKSNVKVPMIYAKVALKNAHAWKKLGIYSCYLPASDYCLIQLDYPVSMGDYQHAKTPDDPIVLHCVRIATTLEGADAREKYRNGRRKLIGQSHENLQAELMNILQNIYALAGEKAEDNIQGITFNRWAHGYSYEQVALWDSDATTEATTSLMKKPIGNIFIANSDAAWMPYLQSAIDEGSRAAQEALA